jgi:hypothetical protein
MAIFLPGYGQVKDTNVGQSNPIDSAYSPRLFGAPPQLSNLCDMRIQSSKDGLPGAVGDMYLNDILKNCQTANFFIGRALFTGGFNSVVAAGLNLAAYVYAYSKYGIHGNNQSDSPTANVYNEALREMSVSFNEKALSVDETSAQTATTEEDIKAQQELDALVNGTDINLEDEYSTDGSVASISEALTARYAEALNTEQNEVDEETEEVSQVNAYTSLDEISSSLGENYNNLEATGIENGSFLSMDITTLDEAANIINSLASGFSNKIKEGGATVYAALMGSLLVEQPFYTFEADWKTYINNVKMMINSAVVMLGLQSAYVRIGNEYCAVGRAASYSGGDDVWTKYRYITADGNIGTHTSIDNLKGETSQYVSFMVDPVSESETYTNTYGQSKIYATAISAGSEIGTEIAFITNSSQSAIDDNVIKLAGGAINTAEKIMGSLAGGIGKFTAAVASGMAKSYTGDHTIYPDIFKEHISNDGGMTLRVKLRASRGDPYTYLIDVLVPLFHILGMALPKMSKNSAASYQYPPLIQCNVPGIWGTRLGAIQSLSITKNPEGDGVSINGYPMSINVDIHVQDLMHTLVTTPMDSPALFLNNQTMFDYIAQCTGVDRYRANPAIRIITKIALAASYADSMFYNIGESLVSDATHILNSAKSIAIK